MRGRRWSPAWGAAAQPEEGGLPLVDPTDDRPELLLRAEQHELTRGQRPRERQRLPHLVLVSLGLPIAGP
jgi:hypothetical protein